VTERAVGLDDSALAAAPAPPHSHDRLHVVVDLRDQGSQEVLRFGPWLSPDANLLTAPDWVLALRRPVDVLGSLVGMVLLLPLFLAVAIAIKTTSPGPAFFKQRRVGKDGVEFDLVKFRSMKFGAENERVHLLHHNESSGPVFKIKQDPRITRIGRWIRRASIDELPQLWNVLKGNMRLVGPRPPLPTEVAKYGAWEKQRLTVKPGMTCIWQVSGRADLDFDTWVSMDIEYIENWSPWLDLRLLLQTIPAVLSGRGAY
jgi:lipopolysaccharide/colanic/teichoic acid biosynthesis glycosyltransferase